MYFCIPPEVESVKGAHPISRALEPTSSVGLHLCLQADISFWFSQEVHLVLMYVGEAIQLLLFHFCECSAPWNGWLWYLVWHGNVNILRNVRKDFECSHIVLKNKQNRFSEWSHYTFVGIHLLSRLSALFELSKNLQRISFLHSERACKC